jgi:hypothetical protein
MAVRGLWDETEQGSSALLFLLPAGPGKDGAMVLPYHTPRYKSMKLY